MEEPKDGRLKLGLAACIVVIVCLLIFSGWNYVRINDMQKRATELKAQVADLESLVSSLETDVENLTNTIYNVTFPFMGTEKAEIQTVTWTSPNLVTLGVENTGTKALTVTGVKVNYGNVECSSPTIPKTIDTGNFANIQITFTNNYTAGTTYDLTVVTSDGHEYTRTATSPTPLPPEGKMIKYDSAFINATSDMVNVYVRNWGTEQVTLDKVYIDAEDCTQSVTSPAGFQTAGALLNVDAVVKITVSGTAAGLDFVAGSTYVLKVAGPGVEWEESVGAS